MPAIEFSRLRTKIELLGRVYDRPEQFVKDLLDLNFFYSDLTFQDNNPVTFRVDALESYRVPLVINRELEKMLRPRAIGQPEETLKIIDQLWQTRKFEPCQLAAGLLGALPISFSSQVLERIHLWTQARESSDLLEMLHLKGTETIRKQNPELWIANLHEWLSSPEPFRHKQAVIGLQPILQDENFKNLPILFDFLQPVLEDPDPHLTLPLLEIVEKIRQKSEPETVYFLKQIIHDSTSADLPRFIRRALPGFSQEAQISLKTYMRENSNA